MQVHRRQFLLAAGASVASAQLLHSAQQNTHREDPPLLFGVDYYPDQTPQSLWEEDARQMAATGIDNVRIAEFAWALMEPSEGQFDFTWLKRSVSILHAHNIAVILGTPSAAPPPWLTQKYPEVLMVNDQGVTLQPGARRFTCPTNETYRRLAVAIATQMARTFASTPGVIGWQIDNELTLGSSGRCYCRFCRAGFQQWLKTKYGALDALNSAWGTVFWSQTYTDFSQIPVPLPSGAPPNPGLELDYDRYQSYANVTFLDDQLTVLRQLCPSHFVTTNNVPLVDTINMRDLYAKLDFVASDSYPGFSAIYSGQPGTSTPLEQVRHAIAFSHDFSRSIKNGKPFMIMEEQTGKAGQPFFSPQPEPGQLRLWAFQAIAHGASGVNFFRWDTAAFGAEEYWHGMLNHDRSKSPGFAEIERTMHEAKQLGAEVLGAPYEAALALCVDLNSGWALKIQPGQPKLSYLADAIAWYTCASASHAGIDVVDATGDLSRYKAVLAPLMYVVSREQAGQIRSYVQNGGTFISGVRLGVKDEHSQIVRMPLPGILRDVMGVTLLDYEPIYSEKQAVRFSSSLGSAEAECSLWADILDPHDAEVLATYTIGQYAGKAAVTSHRYGKGRALYVGAHLEGADLARVLLALLGQSGVQSRLRASPSIEITTRRVGGQVITYLLNHAPNPETVSASGKDLLSGESFSGSVPVEPYGVRVLRQ